MAFELFVPTLALNSDLCRIKRRAFNTFNVYEVALPLHDHQAVEDYLAAREELWHKNPDQRIIAVREVSSGRAVAFTRWSIPSPYNVTTAALVSPPLGSKIEVLTAFHDGWKDLQHQYVDVAKDWTIVSVATDPDFERKGCAGMMLRHITCLADEAGVKMNVGASRAGIPLYAKFGFEEQEKLLMDFSHHGGEKDAMVATLMIRNPQPRNVTAQSAPE